MQPPLSWKETEVNRVEGISIIQMITILLLTVDSHFPGMKAFLKSLFPRVLLCAYRY